MTSAIANRAAPPSLISFNNELLSAVVESPLAGQLLGAVTLRLPYKSMPSVVLVDLQMLSPDAAAAVLQASSTRSAR